MQIRMALIQHFPNIISESVKPMEKIEGINIFQMDGLNGFNSNTSINSEQTTGSLSDQLVNSALRYRGQAPLVDFLMAELGLKGSKINDLTTVLNNDDIKSADNSEPPKNRLLNAK